MSSDQDLGAVLVPAMDLYKASGDLLTYVLQPPSDVEPSTKAGILSLRCFPATEAHLKKFGKTHLTGKLRGFAKDLTTKVKDNTLQVKEKMDKGLQKPMQGLQDFSTRVMDVPKSAAEKVSEAVQTMADMSHKSHRKDDSSDSDDDDDDVDDDEQDSKQPPVSPKKAPPPAPAVPEKLKIIVEVVAGRKLLVGDVVTSDPYVKVLFGQKEIHKTKHLLKTYVPKPSVLSIVFCLVIHAC